MVLVTSKIFLLFFCHYLATQFQKSHFIPFGHFSCLSSRILDVTRCWSCRVHTRRGVISTFTYPLLTQCLSSAHFSNFSFLVPQRVGQLAPIMIAARVAILITLYEITGMVRSSHAFSIAIAVSAIHMSGILVLRLLPLTKLFPVLSISLLDPLAIHIRGLNLCHRGTC